MQQGRVTAYKLTSPRLPDPWMESILYCDAAPFHVVLGACRIGKHVDGTLRESSDGRVQIVVVRKTGNYSYSGGMGKRKQRTHALGSGVLPRSKSPGEAEAVLAAARAPRRRPQMPCRVCQGVIRTGKRPYPAVPDHDFEHKVLVSGATRLRKPSVHHVGLAACEEPARRVVLLLAAALRVTPPARE